MPQSNRLCLEGDCWAFQLAASQAQARDRLSKFSGDVVRMLLSAGDLPKRTREKLGVSDKLLAELRQISQVSGQWSDKIAVKKSSGSMAKGEKMQVAALWAMRLLDSFTHKRPTSTRAGLYVRITELLHEIATGRHGNAENACRRIVSERRRLPDFYFCGELEIPDWERTGAQLLPSPPLPFELVPIPVPSLSRKTRKLRKPR
jgi:hypothetical protein